MMRAALRRISARNQRRARRLSTVADISTTGLRPFLVEQYVGWFDGSDSLSSSECEPLSMRDLLEMADPHLRNDWENLSLGYPAFNTGSASLRKAISAQYEGLSYEKHINVCAPQEGIWLAMRAVLSPGDHVVATTPCYQSLTEVARSVGCDLDQWDPTFSEGRPWFDPDKLAKLLRPDTKLLVVNFPHNPTGALPSLDEFSGIIAMCRQAGVWIFADEMYRGLEHTGHAMLPNAVDVYPEKGISLGGLSKSYGLPGLRIGWLASKNEDVMHRVSLLKDYSSICPPVPSEVLARIALDNKEPIQRAHRERLTAGLKVSREFCEQHDKYLEWSEPSGGTFCFPRLKSSGASAQAYAESLRKRSSLMLMPSSHFLTNDDRLRLCFGRDGAALRQHLARWSEDIEKYGMS